MNNNCFTFIILGATGDLTKRKLIPAIYRRVLANKLEKFSIVGAALSDTTVKEIFIASKKFVKNVDESVWKKIEDNFYYQQLDFYNFDGYIKLKKMIEQVELENFGNRIFYLATMPAHFSIITKYLLESKIVKKNESQARVVYEKPFGYDLKSSRQINKEITKVFKESQIYRIDHYLGKELIGDIALVRFTNRIFEPLWNNKNIESIQIVLNEDIGIEGRGEFYDSTGAMNDVVQSHILQILALVSMETPKALSGKYIRDAKANVLKKIKVDSVVLGQYEGYCDEPGVKKKSKTETFVSAKLFINNKRWDKIPFYIKTGKCLSKKEIYIHIRFKMVKCPLESCPADPNYLTIAIQPDEGFYLGINSKIPGKYEVTPVQMEFCHSCLYGGNTPQAYENLLGDVMKGDQSVFLRYDEIELSWKIIEAMKAKKSKLYTYKKCTTGPKEQGNIRWRL